MENMNKAIALSRQALELYPPRHPQRSKCLNTLATCFSTLYEHLGVMTDLNEAIVLGRGALELCPPWHSNRSVYLNNLVVDLSTRYEQLRKVTDLDEVIVLEREALERYPPGHADRSTFLNKLVVRLSDRYIQLGVIKDLDEAIFLSTKALERHLPGPIDQWMPLNNLATRLSTRYEQLQVKTTTYLDVAIVLSRKALDLCPPGHVDRWTSLTNLAAYLSARYNQLGVMTDLDETIALSREALGLCPPRHVNQSISLNNLAVRLSTRYDQLRVVMDFDEVIVLGREALELRPRGHVDRLVSLENLAAWLSSRYKQLGDMRVLNEAIFLGRDALALCPTGHPNRSRSLVNLARLLHTRFTGLGRLEDMEGLFSLYAELAYVTPTVSSADISAAGAWIHAAEDLRHSTTLLAYQTSLRLLVQHLATLLSSPQHSTVPKNLTSSLAVDAFSACLRSRSLTYAVELLEQGQGVLWSQLTHLRSLLDDVIRSTPGGKALAAEFTKLTLLVRNVLDSPGADQHDRLHHLNSELQDVVANIRGLPGLSRFLLPPLFSDLQQAPSGGPIIIVNASEYGCDALVVSLHRDPIRIPLQITKGHVQELSSSVLHTLTLRPRRIGAREDLCVLLWELWDDVVSPIVDILRMIHRPQSRIWWCLTADFSRLPLHAAGPYKEGQQNFADLYISSYTPTLAALIRARRPAPLSSSTERTKIVAIGQATAIEESELVSVGTELTNIGQKVLEGLATFTRIEGPESCISRVAEELGKNHWVHFACHVSPNRKQPFGSAFALHDGLLAIEHIMRCGLENPQFAYLSTCHTAVGGEDSLDEGFHLGPAMQFAGFRSVIGTMGGVDRDQTPKITSMIYENMIDESGHLNHTRAAFALHKTMKTLVDVPLEQRILYIHLGA